MNVSSENEDLDAVIQATEQLDRELSSLFDRETVEQASLLDIADINLSDEMVECISNGIVRLKQLRRDTNAQRSFVEAMTPGERLLLCMWIREMDLLEKIR